MRRRDAEAGAGRKRTMMARSLLHGVSTVAGLLAMHGSNGAPMWVRMSFYVVSWIACAAAYLPILYLAHHLVDAWDERTRRVVREELERHDLLAFKRRIDRDRKRHVDRSHAEGGQVASDGETRVARRAGTGSSSNAQTNPSDSTKPTSSNESA